MGVGGVIGDVLAGVLIIAAVYVLVRPQSAAASAVNMLSNAFVAMVKTATDL